MKDSHITLRISADLVRALAGRARAGGVAKSQVVREAVAAYLSGLKAPARPAVRASELAARWATLPRLAPTEAAALARDLAAARKALPPPSSWD
ncbi:MAG TPA: CopG family transcriptional regulator [Gemmatimonadales bacterium]|jgi:hypothetical protein